MNGRFCVHSEDSKCECYVSEDKDNPRIIDKVGSSYLDSRLNQKYLIMTDIYVDDKKDTHNVDIFGKTEDGRYLCHDTIAGKTLALEYSDFAMTYLVIIHESNPSAFK